MDENCVNVVEKPARGMTIRLLVADDLPAASKMGKLFYSEGGLPGTFSEEVFCKTWDYFLSSGSGVIFGWFVERKMVGAIGGAVYPDPNDGCLVASEFFWFVRKESRGGGIALLNEFEKWATDRGARRIVMVHLTNLMPDSIGELYRRRGYKPVEVHYLKEI